MSNEHASSSTTESLLRTIPSVDRLLESPVLSSVLHSTPRSLVVDAARHVLDQCRAEIRSSGGAGGPVNLEALAHRVSAEAARLSAPPLSPVVNATGIIIHTNLGRAPLAGPVVGNMADVARGYAPIEMNLDEGVRGKRTSIVRPLLCELTGAESATVVNNNAAALVILLNTLAKGRSVIVSRGELIEIGGSFRLPAVMEAGGCRLREVGSTNRTRLRDFEDAIDDDTAALLAVHPSNYRVQGFTEAVSIEDLVALGRERDIPVIHDTGSGLLRPHDHPALSTEPDAQTSIRTGADLVLFSGDKLLGGPQAGIIVGRSDLVAKIEANPLMRAMRVDKLTLAALGTTLQLHRDAAQAMRDVPVLAMIYTSCDELRERAGELKAHLGELAGSASVTIELCHAYVGGGSLPTEQIQSVALRITPSAPLTETELSRRLRTGDPPVVARTHDASVWLDMRTIRADQLDTLAASLRRVLTIDA